MLLLLLRLQRRARRPRSCDGGAGAEEHAQRPRLTMPLPRAAMPSASWSRWSADPPSARLWTCLLAAMTQSPPSPPRPPPSLLRPVQPRTCRRHVVRGPRRATRASRLLLRRDSSVPSPLPPSPHLCRLTCPARPTRPLRATCTRRQTRSHRCRPCSCLRRHRRHSSPAAVRRCGHDDLESCDPPHTLCLRQPLQLNRRQTIPNCKRWIDDKPAATLDRVDASISLGQVVLF